MFDGLEPELCSIGLKLPSDVHDCPGKPVPSRMVACKAGAAPCCAAEEPVRATAASNVNIYLNFTITLLSSISFDRKPTSYLLALNHRFPEAVLEYGAIHEP